MTDESDLSPGEMVFDRDDPDPDPARVVNCIPGASADEWNVLGGNTVADDNPEYPSDAQVIAIAYESNLDANLPEWDRTGPVGLTELNAAGVTYYSFPAPRLVRDHEQSSTSETQSESNSDRALATLRDIQYVGEARANALRAAGYESVRDVAMADESVLSEVEGIGNTRAAQITANATDLLGELSDGSAADTPDKMGTDAPESGETPDGNTEPSAAIVALSRFLESDGMDATIGDDGQSVRVSKADDSYRVSLAGVEGDGPYRSQLEKAVEKVRAATQQTNS